MEMIKNLFNRNYVSLFLGQLSTHLGDAIVQVLLIMWIMNNFEKPGSMIAWVLFCFVFPSLIISPIAGILVDRFSRKKIMIMSALYRGLVLVAGLVMFLFGKTVLSSTSIPVIAVVLSILIGAGTAFSILQKWLLFLMLSNRSY